MIDTNATESTAPVGEAQSPSPEQVVQQPASDVETESGAVETDAYAEADGEESSERPRGKDKRIDQLTRLRREAERERDLLRMQLMALQAQLQGTRPQPQASQESQPQAVLPPDPSKYPLGVVDEAYHRDLVAYQQKLAQQASMQAASAEVRRALATMMQQTRVQQLTEAYEARAREVFSDATELREAEERVVSALAGTPQGMVVGEAIGESEYGPLLMKHLADHPDELRRLKAMTPALAARYIGRLEERLAAERRAAAMTKAPPPPRTVRGGNNATTDPLTMTDEQFRERLLKTVLQRR